MFFRARPDPLAPSALRNAWTATGLVLVAALVGASVRLLPWALDPTIPWAELGPFAKSLLALAVEAAILTGWPVGWALATHALADRGEARVLASLGESPGRTVSRLAPQAAVFAAVLAATSITLGREAAAPGRVVDALLARGRGACATASAPATYGVPFVPLTWLCPGQTAPARIVGRAPIGGVLFTAADARVSDDLRRIDLDDARLALTDARAGAVHVRVGSMTLRGLPPWARASSLPPVFRALVVTVSALTAACATVFALLRLAARARRLSGAAAAALGAAGPLTALAALRGLELRVPDAAGPGWLAAFALVPISAVAAVAAVLAITNLAAALPHSRRAGS